MVPALAVLAVLSQASAASDGGALPPPPPVHTASAVPTPNDTAEPVKTPVPKEDTFREARAAENEPSPAGANPPTADLGEWWKKMHPFGYVKAGIFYTFPFTNEQLVGGNGGFRVAAARLGVELALVDNVSVVASIELAAPQLNPADPLTGGRIVEMRDAYVEYRVCKGFWVRAGQFKAPFNGETLLGDADLPFLTRSVMTDGIVPPEGYSRDGLTLGRQIGLMISSDYIGTKNVGFRYFVAGVNGNGQNQLFNENNLIAPVARLELDLLGAVHFAVNGFYNVVAIGIRPNRINQTQLGYGADLTVRLGGFRALVGFVGRNNSYGTSDNMMTGIPSDTSMGLLAQLHYVFESIGIEAGVRFSWLEPSTAKLSDRVWDIDAMLAYRFKKVPLRVLLQYSHREEEPAVAIGNESIDAMVQATW